MRIRKCQCPIGLYLYFYWENPFTVKKELSKCQCPIGLYLYFYKIAGVIAAGTLLARVNALSGFICISTKKKWFKGDRVNRCQCPIGLYLYFYIIKGETNHGKLKCVNALSGFICISTRINLFLTQSHYTGVNALSGFICIST